MIAKLTLRHILKLRKYVPDVLRYSGFIHSCSVMLPYFYAKVKYIDNHDLSIENDSFSLSVGMPLQLRYQGKGYTIWKSDNPRVIVSPNGIIYARHNAIGSDSRATITASNSLGDIKKKYQVTIVNWVANKSRLVITGRLPGYRILAYDKGVIYFSIGRKLNITKDGFRTKSVLTSLPVLPAKNFPMLVNQYGYFIIGEKKLLHSPDMFQWNLIGTLAMHGNANMFDYYIDSAKEVCYIFVGEYSCDPNVNHKLYRGCVHKDGSMNWQVILDFDSINTYNQKKRIKNSARHIHIVVIDPYTGFLWVGTGDDDAHSKIMFSKNYGDNFNILGLGSQEWRTLSIWFTKRYIYWNMDSHEPQKIFRVNRDILREEELFFTPDLQSGKTRIGYRYLVTKNMDKNRFPVDRGSAYIESIERVLDVNNAVIAINDEKYDKKELVAVIDNGAHFYSCWAKTDKNEDVVIMGTSPEGNIRDMKGRVFGILEKPDGSCLVQELISLSPKRLSADYNINMFTQLIPLFQDCAGEIYFKSRNLKWPGIYKAKLIWGE